MLLERKELKHMLDIEKPKFKHVWHVGSQSLHVLSEELGYLPVGYVDTQDEGPGVVCKKVPESQLELEEAPKVVQLDIYIYI